MQFKGVTRRWLINGFGIIFVVLVTCMVVFIVITRNFYYVSVSKYMSMYAKDSLSMSTLENVQDREDLFVQSGTFLENYKDADKIEVMIMDATGQIIANSSGFSPDKDIPVEDFNAAKKSENGTGEWIGRLPSDEKVLSVTLMIRRNGVDVGAVRYLTSLSVVDRQILMAVMVVAAVTLVVMVFATVSSLYFINSIVIPVREIGVAARRIALGDFDARIERTYNDEIGELCDTINYMAGELGTAEKLKNDFISLVSHELRTPLTAIRGWSETVMTQGEHDPEVLHKGMEVIISESSRLSSMVEDLLDYSRIKTGRITIHKEKMDILAELEEAVVLNRERSRSENVTIHYEEVESLPFVMGDRDRLKQVFLNIIDNAIKYSRENGNIYVRAMESSGYIIISIKDDGVGISVEDLPRVKEKFYKGTGSRRGFGIGLAVAEEIITAHDGYLDIDSREGEGTTVIISLPTISAA